MGTGGNLRLVQSGITMKASLDTAPSGDRSDFSSVELGFKNPINDDEICAKEGVLTAESAFRSDGIAGSARLAERVQRRAMEAVIWGMPMVKFDTLRQAFFRDAKASYGDIAYWLRPADANVQWTAPTPSAHIYFNFNTKDGPVVFDLPSTRDVCLSGSLFNSREQRLIDLGTDGVDRSRGGKFLLLPPNYNAIVPAGYIPVRCTTYNGYALLSVPPTPSLRSITKKMQLYPLRAASNPPRQRLINMSGKIFDAVIHFDDTFFDSLARVVNEEPFQACDLVARNQIYFLGIEQGKVFRPDFMTRELLSRSAGQVHTCLMQGVMNSERWWSSSNWKRGDLLWPKTPFSPEIARRLGIDERHAEFFAAFETPQKQQKHADSHCAIHAFSDAKDEPLQGDCTYSLHIPAHVPAYRGWTMTAYDLSSASFIRNSPAVAISSGQRTLKKNADGSVDLYFGPKSPDGKGSNWIYTAPGCPWFTVFRMSGPDREFFDKTWALPNLQKNEPSPTANTIFLISITQST